MKKLTLILLGIVFFNLACANKVFICPQFKTKDAHIYYFDYAVVGGFNVGGSITFIECTLKLKHPPREGESPYYRGLLNTHIEGFNSVFIKNIESWRKEDKNKYHDFLKCDPIDENPERCVLECLSGSRCPTEKDMPWTLEERR